MGLIDEYNGKSWVYILESEHFVVVVEWINTDVSLCLLLDR